MRLCTTLFLTVIASLSLPTPQAAAEPGRLGVMVDAGVPDGVTGSLIFRPIGSLLVHGGVGTNLIGPGVRAGVSYQPLSWVLRPSLNVEGGHYFPGDANEALRRVGAAEPDSEDHPMLEKVGYSYSNLHLGLEVGGERATFYVHAGFSLIRSELHNTDAAFNGDTSDPMSDGPGVEIRDDPVITMWTPSARLGLIFFL